MDDGPAFAAANPGRRNNPDESMAPVERAKTCLKARDLVNFPLFSAFIKKP